MIQLLSLIMYIRVLMFTMQSKYIKERLLLQEEIKKEKKREILNDINIDIKKGETVALIGVNGSGKSTLLKINDTNNFSK